MVQKYVVLLTDDISGETIEDGKGESVRFALDGAAYTIDLAHENAEKLREAFRPYLNAARKSVAAHTPPRGSRGSTGPKRDLAPVREWLRAAGHTVPDRGRIPGALMDEYDSAH